MRILGIDPGSETLGWGVIDGTLSRYEMIEFGTVRSSPKLRFSLRLLGIYRALGELIDLYSPDVVAVEDTFFAVNASTALKLGQVRGIVLLAAEAKGLEIAEYAPRLVKSTVAGHGAADKMQVGQMLRVLLKLKTVPKPHDAADALAIAICHIHHAGMKDRINRATQKK